MRPRKSTATFSGQTKAAILRSKMTGWVDLVTPYRADFVDALKSQIQPSHRQWDPAMKVWHVQDMFLEKVIDMLGKYFDEVTTDLVEEKSAISGNLWTEVFKAIPKDTADKVYYALAMAVHPDHGGSNEQMTLLNKAYQECK